MKPLRTTECLFAAPGDSQSIIRGVFGGGARKHTLHRMHLARGVWFGAKDTWGVCNTPLPYRQKKLSLMIELWRLPSAISATYPPLQTKALRTTECLSAALDENPPPFQRPIYYTRRKPSTILVTYPPHRMIAFSNSVSLSPVSDDRPQQFLRPIGGAGYSL